MRENISWWDDDQGDKWSKYMDHFFTRELGEKSKCALCEFVPKYWYKSLGSIDESIPERTAHSMEAHWPAHHGVQLLLWHRVSKGHIR